MIIVKVIRNFKIAAILCAIYVTLGAFGAHGLKDKLSVLDLATYETGLRYLIIHALGIILVNTSYHQLAIYNSWTIRLFYAGIILFSGSLIIHATRHLLGFDMNVFALIAPIGGLCFIAGWLVYFFSVRKA